MPERNNFVAAYPEPKPKIEIVDERELPTAPIVPPMPYSGHVDRAQGFTIATGPLAIVTGLVVALVGVIGWRVPVASLMTLLLALGGFALVWLLAYLAHVFVSSDGALVLHTVMGWNYLRREQKERFKRYGIRRGE